MPEPKFENKELNIENKLKKEIEFIDKELTPLLDLWEKTMRDFNIKKGGLKYILEEDKKGLEKAEAEIKKMEQDIHNNPDFKKMFKLNDRKHDLQIELQGLNKK